ncbi:MAG: hypothetical protein KJ556_21685 [Gammaproteobacteria bacterium]|nr:hypothetical protein [Gammaproteobacteria bacterium]MBU2249772.1 hypothetical protein [Gammaproteobacteria bacterium]
MMRYYRIKKASEDVISLVGGEGVTIINDQIILDPMKITGMIDWVKWIEGLRLAAFYNQRGKCLCGEELRYSGELHHSLISKADVRGTRDEAKYRIIQHSYNVLFLHQKCHEKAVRRRCLVYLIELFGESVNDWYNSIAAQHTLRRL